MQTIDQKIKETIESGDDKGKVSRIVDDMEEICNRYVSPPYRKIALVIIMRCFHRYAEMLVDVRGRLLREAVRESMKSQGFHRSMDLSFLAGVVCGASALAATVLMITAI